MSFEIDIVVDPSKALPGIAKVETSLAKVEVAGPRVGAAVTRGMREGAAAASSAAGSVGNFGEALARVAKYEKILAGEAAQAKVAVGNLANAFGQLATHLRGEALKGASKAFAGLTEQLQREAAVLERIKGPMREHMADLRSLEMLYRKGSITASEYQAEQGRMGPAPGTKPSGLSGALGGIGTKVAAGAGLAYGAKQVLDMADAYTGLENRLRQVTSSEGELAAMMTKTREIANGARMEWGAVGESFVRLTGATQNLGLSQGQVLNLTDNLSKTIQLSGATSSEAAAGMLQLSQAFASGRLQGDEFRSVSENLPIVMQMLSKELGVSRGELKKMASEGKITSDILAKTFLGGDAAIELAFGKTTATAAQQWTVFKNELTATAGELVKSSQIVPLLGSALQAVIGIVGPLAEGLGEIVGGIASVGKAAKDAGSALGLDLNIGLGTVAGMILGGPFGAAMGTLAESLLKKAKSGTDGFRDALAEARNRMEDLRKEAERTPWLFNEMADAVEESVAQLERLRIKAASVKDLGSIPDALFGGAGRLNKAVGMFFDDPWGESTFQKGLRKVGFKEKPAGGSRTAKDTVTLDPDKGARNVAVQRFAPDIGTSISDLNTGSDPLVDSIMKQQEAMHDYGKWQTEFDAQVRKTQAGATELDKTLDRLSQQTMSQLTEAALSFGDALVDSIMDADFSWSKFIEGMATDMLKMSVRSFMQMGIAAMTGGSMPAAAVGGSWTVGGSGGTDSQVAMLRVTPRERITVDTPGQMDQAEGRRSGGGGRKMVTVQQPDGSRARFLTEDDFEELFITMTDRHSAAMRSRLTGR